jgi:hypothetical protein
MRVFFGVLPDLCLIKLESADDILANDKAVTIPSILVPDLRRQRNT